MATRRTIKRIRPARADAFDDQFWPVVVAICVLAAIAAGAIVTLLKGTSMWLGLILLPATTVATLVFLSRMGESSLRRTLQFALIVSLACHLVILIVASLILIFNNFQEKDFDRVAQKKVPTIRFSNTENSVTIPVSKPENVPEPEVEVQRQQSTVVSTQQPLPVQKQKPTPTPQVRQREIARKSVPKFSESTSQLRRSETSASTRSAVSVRAPQLTKTSPAAKPAKPNASETNSQSELAAASEASKTIERSTSVSANPKVVVDSKPQPMPKSEIVPRRENRPSITRANRSSSDAPQSRLRSTNSNRKSASANIRRPEVNLRRETAKASPAASKARPVENAAKMQPAEASGRLTRRPRRSESVEIANQPSPVTRKATAKPRRSDLARREVSTQPVLTNPLSNTRSSRVATNDAPTIRSPEPVSRVAPNPTSADNAAMLQPRTLSVSKGQTGTAGAIANLNLQSGEGGLPSPAVRPSDAVLNRKTQSPSETSRRLTNSQSASVRRSTAEAPKPESALRSNTTSPARIAGSKEPSTRSVESSAAEINAASNRSTQKVAIEQGSAVVNLGPTKVVSQIERRKLSGGGSPNVSRLNPSQTRRSASESTQRPTLASTVDAPTAAPRETAARPDESLGAEASDVAMIDRRSEGSDSMVFAKDAAPSVDPSADAGSSNASLLAALPRSDRESDSRSQSDGLLREVDSNTGETDDEDKKRLQQLMGDSANRIATAPTRNQKRASGSAGEGEAEEAAESSTASRSQSSSGSALPIMDAIGQSAARMAIQSATTLPVIDGAIARRSRPSNSDDPLRMRAESSNSRRRSSNETAPVISSSIATAEPGNSGKGATPDATENPDETSVAELSRGETGASESGLRFDVSAIQGPAGLGPTPDLNAGVNMKPASTESTQIQPELETRFRRDDFGSAPSISPTATIAKEAFRKRTPGMAENAAEPKTEAAINLGLEFLARFQQADGSWSLTQFDTQHPLHQYQLDSDMAATGLAVLSFQGAGYNHREFKYARQVNRAIEWLIENQTSEGLLYLEADEGSNQACRLYSHAIAALALTEAYGMTQDPKLKAPAQKALDLIASSQHPELGGWRYFIESKNRSSDTSVTGWMVMALQSGRLSGLEVRDSTFDRIRKWLKVATDPSNESLFRYNPYAVNTPGVSRIQRRNATPSMTAVGLLMRIYMDWDGDDPKLIAGARYLVQQQLPGETVRLRDTYYWYYATQVLKHVGGPEWETWNRALLPLLVRTQEKEGKYAGSWDPYSPAPDRWARFGGRLYVTTMNLLSLEVRHRLLPLYQKTNRPDEDDSLPAITIE